MAYENMQFDWAPAMERQSDPSFWNVLSQTPWAGTSFNQTPAVSGRLGSTSEGYQLGFNKLNNVGTWALRDPSGKIVNSYQGAARGLAEQQRLCAHGDDGDAWHRACRRLWRVGWCWCWCG